jgi:hypothetical protein
MSAPLFRTSGYIALAFVLAPGLMLIVDALAGATGRSFRRHCIHGRSARPGP